MSNPSEITELEAVRHDLRNVLTALRHGCMLIGSKLDKVEHEEAHAFLDEMGLSIKRGSALVDRLRPIEGNAGESA